MRAKRVKQQRKTMQVFASSYNFHEPYQVLVDADFCLACASQQLAVESRISTVLGGQVKLLISQCCVNHLYELGPTAEASTAEKAQGERGQESVELARTFTRRKCNHWKTKPKSGDCVKSLIGADNKNRYVVATQDANLRDILRKIPGVPLLYLNSSSVVILEQPSEATLTSKAKIEQAKQHVGIEELAAIQSSLGSTVPTLNSQEASPPQPSNKPQKHAAKPIRSAEQILLKRGKRKAKGPNPLSMKKRKHKQERPISKKKSLGQSSRKKESS